jgi:ketosteroid isomerase-like protein
MSRLATSFIGLVLVLNAVHALAQETPDHQAIRMLLDADQAAWQAGDVEAILGFRTADYMVAGVPMVNGAPDLLGVHFGRDYDEMKATLLDPEWTAPSADVELKPKVEYEMPRISIKGDKAVAVSRIEWSQIDTTLGKRVHMGWNSLWFLVKTENGWKFKSAVAGVNQWTRETNK